MTSVPRGTCGPPHTRRRETAENPSLRSIGLVGLGNVGMHYVARLLDAKETLYVHDLDRDKVEAAVAQGAHGARSSCEVAEHSATVVLALPDPGAVRDEMLGDDGVLDAKCDTRLVIDVSTIDPDTARRLHGEAARRGYDGGFAVDLMHKDHRLAGELGRRRGVALPFNELALKTYDLCRSRGHGRKSHAIVAQTVAEAAGVALRRPAR